ncbi:MAG: signal peptidase I [Ktedonobacterales bacterium]|nr:signal peptidase I [Ktedonobacterales bacterium]
MGHRDPASRSADYAFEDEQGEHWGARLLREVLEVAVLTLLLFVAVRMFVQNYRVEGPSMQPTLHTSEYILVDKAEYYLHSPQRGDVIVFQSPPNPQEAYVKRVIGVPGDTVMIAQDGTVTVDRTVITEPYVADNDNPYGPKTWFLGPNQYFVLGDNRGDSSDSRYFGPVDRKLIIGKAALVYWPLADLHPLQTFSSVFAGIHP